MRLRYGGAAPLAALLSGLLLVLGFPPFTLGGLAWIGLVPLLVALEGATPRVAFGLAYLTGLVFIVGSFAWIWTVPGYNLLDEALLGFYLGLYVALWGLGVSWIRRQTALPLALVAPPLWVALEYVRSNLSFLGLPWMLLGHTQHRSIPIIQIVSLTGVAGLSFLIVLVNVALAQALLHARWRLRPGWTSGAPVRLPVGPLLAGGLLLAALWAYGLSVMGEARPGGERITTALVHTAVPREQKWDLAQRRVLLERNETLTRQAAAGAPQLIVWPETAVPGDVRHHVPLKQRVSLLAREVSTTLLVGSAEHAKFTDRRMLDRRYNSMYLISPGGEIVGQYRKIALVPFGEYEPLQGIVPWPKIIATAVGLHLPGDTFTVFTLHAVPFSSVICWEIIFPDLVRRFVQNGARFLVNASNEAWFAGSALSEQMLAIAVFRAVENRTAIARASNMGVSAIIDPQGRITQRFSPAGSGPAAEGVLAGEVPLGTAGTFYSRHGDVFALAGVVASVAMLAGSGFPGLAGRLRRRFAGVGDGDRAPAITS
jgi:apolipoprotein N-acyltransferase